MGTLMIDIVFMTEFTGLNNTDITDFEGLRQLGDEKISNLVSALNETSHLSKASSTHVNLLLVVAAILSTMAIYT